MFDKLLASMRSVFRNNKTVAMVTPSIIGLLPMPGGALVSAPLVENATEKMDISSEFKTFVNYWFRHIWEFVWPIYAGLLLFQAMSEIPLKKIILVQSPYTFLNILTGIAIVSIYFRKNKTSIPHLRKSNSMKGTIHDFFGGVWPLILIILQFFMFSIPLHISMVTTSIALTVTKKINIKNIGKYLFSPLIGKTMILMISVLVFQKIIYISNVFSSFNTEHLSFNFLIFLCFLISFSIGFLTGVNTAYIAIAYPILLPLINNMPEFLNISIYIYVIGFSGILLSPVHLCLVLTNEYFKSDLFKVYKYLLPPVLLLIVVSTFAVILV